MLNAAQAELRKMCGITSGWVRPENVHLTIKFLGDIDDKKIPEIIAALKGAAGGIKPFTLTAGNLGGFPNPRSPRVLWMGVNDSLELQALQRNIETRLHAVGIAKDERPFRAHLTLLRIKEHENGRKAGEAVKKMKHEISMDFHVDSFVLFRSTLSLKEAGPLQGARHDIIERIRL